MKLLQLIGIGTGDPELLTLAAVGAIERTTVFFIVEKGAASSELVAIRTEMLRSHRPDGGYRVVEIPDPPRDRSPQEYRSAVAEWHRARAARFGAAVDGCAADDIGAVLVWGDPALYDSTIRVVEDVIGQGRDFDWSVIPAVSSVSALAAAHRIVLNTVGGPVHITTGRRLAAGWPGEQIDTVVVMLDADLRCGGLDPTGIEICWAANLGTPGQLLAAGPLRETLPRIRDLRQQAKADRGWVMDIYLLRRTDAADQRSSRSPSTSR